MADKETKVIGDDCTSYINDQFYKMTKIVQITENYEFDMRENINKIDLYRASQFKTGDKDSQGNRKFFFNILLPANWNASKNIDVDLKDIKIFSKDGSDPLKAKVYSELFMKWAKKNHFSKFLNKMTEFLPAYGWFVSKFVNGKVEYVPCKDVYCYPGVDNITKSGGIMEVHKMQPSQIKSFNWNQKEAINEVISLYNSSNDAQYIPIKQYYGIVPNQLIDKKFWNKGTDVWGYSDVYIVAAMNLTVNVSVEASFETIQVSKVLHIKNRENEPLNKIYKDIGYLDIDGRCMKLGVFELGFAFQERWNQIANEKNLAMKLGSKMIFQTRGKTVESNLMTETENGDIIKIDSELNRVSTGVENLGVYSQEENNILGLFRNLSNSQEIMTGESMPSGTPFRLGALLNQNSGMLFQYIREKMSIYLKEVVVDWLLPEFEKEIKKDDEIILQLFNEGLAEEIIERDINRRLNEGIKAYVIANGRFPTQQEIDQVASQLQSEYNKGNVFAKFKASFLDFEKDIEVEIDGEGINITQKVESITNFTQLLAQNPGILQDPVTKKLFSHLMELTGISPGMVGKAQQVPMQPPLNEVAAPPGGNVGAQPPMIQ